MSLNRITEIPAEIQNLINLEHLDLAVNEQISLLPVELFNLNKSKHLTISYGYSLTQIPPDIDKLTNLEYLDLGGNNIMAIPLELQSETAQSS